jgi:glycosyltransferase A (GT-A) superfamily protein (DUF2064 family)
MTAPLRTQVVVITKAPVPGRSKTRLTPPCTPEQAAGIAAAAVGDTGFDVVPQVDGDLGDRLAAAFADAMAGRPAPTLLIGMDTPQVTSELLERCARRLELGGPGTAVLGTAPDGGWWALGLHRADDAAVLTTVPMSRDDTAVRTREALEAVGLVVLDLPELTDIDHFPDAVAVAAQCAPESRTARVVAATLADVGSRA